MKLKTYVTASVEQITQRFLEISRQRISQIIQYYAVEDLTTFKKLVQAKAAAKQIKRDSKLLINENSTLNKNNS